MSSKTLHDRLTRDPRWKKARAYVLERDEGICHLCGGEGADSADHLIPLSRMTPEQWDMGLHVDVNNLKAAHKTCNSARQNKPIERKPWFNTRWLDSI